MNSLRETLPLVLPCADEHQLTIPPCSGTVLVRIVRYAPEYATAALALDAPGLIHIATDGCVEFIHISTNGVLIPPARPASDPSGAEATG